MQRCFFVLLLGWRRSYRILRQFPWLWHKRGQVDKLWGVCVQCGAFSRPGRFHWARGTLHLCWC